MNWQWIIAGVLLIVAVIYIIRTARKNFSGEHDCPSCDVPVHKMKKAGKPKLPAHFDKSR
jgi:hypothetical protein